MSIFEKMVEYFITLNKKMKRWQRAVSLLSAVVVFTTTYALILPAITLDKNTADEQPGIEVAASENNADESGTVYESASEEAPAEETDPEASEDNASEGGQQEDAEVAGQDEAEENAQADTDSADTAAPAENAEAAETTETTEDAATAGTTVEEIAAETGKSVDEIKLITEDTQLIYRGDDYVVYADFGASAKLPVGVQLDVREITKESDPEAYQAYYDKALSQMQDKYDENTQLSFARFYDITFKYEDMEVEPSGNVNVRIEYKQAVEEEKTENVDTVHFDKRNDEQAEVIDSNTKGSETSVEAVEFEADQFSVYGVVGSATIEKTVLASDGNNYNISVSYGPDAGVPEGAELKVEEIADRSKEYNEYLTQTEDTLGWEAGTATYARFFDITIVDKDGGKVDIQAPVDVKIELADKADSSESNLQVVHFGKETEVVEASTEGSAVSFAANGFSVYAVVDDGDTSSHARMTVKFYNGDTEIATMYVKNDDTLDELEKILYDPGLGDSGAPSGAMFKGWIKDKKDYTLEDLENSQDISDIRTWAAGENITEGMAEVKFYAMFYKTISVTYLDEHEIQLGNETRNVLVGDAQIDYTVNMSYTPEDPKKNFEGWNVKTGGSNIQGHTEGKVYENGTNITITGDVTFSVNAPTGNWLIFDENGKGATYNAPQFVKSGEVTKKPVPDSEMKRKGYVFGGWYTDAECTPGNEYNFGEQLTDRKTIYAKWTANPSADYKVIIWKQNVAGDGYDFEESVVLSGTPGTTINTVTQRGTGDNAYARVNGVDKRYEGFHLKNFDQNVTIAAEGTSVVNVYYDRTEYKLTFQVYDYTYTPTTSTSGTQYGLVDGTYVRLTRHGRGTGGSPYYWTYNDTYWSEGPRYTGTRYTSSYDQSWQTIKEITARYQQDISKNFPIEGTNGKIYDNGERWKPTSTTPYSQVLVYIDIMPSANVTFRLDEAERPLKTMNYYVEALPGESGTTTAPNPLYAVEDNRSVSSSGKRFKLHSSISARYNGVTPDEDYLEFIGFDRLGADQKWVESNAKYYIYDEYNDGTINFYYSRKSYPINYMDGIYVDGNGTPIAEPNRGQLKTTDPIFYEQNLSTYNKGGADYYTPTYNNYVFEGWYKDDACTEPYTFTTMPEGGITVYAKWRQIEYRVFLHPNADRDSTLDWGSDTQGMSFKVANGGKVSLPTGHRTNYEMIGWFLDEGCTQVYPDGYVLNEDTVKGAYDKTVDLTDPMDKWGEGATYNADLDRPWITKKLDIYAKWRRILEGADGIGIIYDANGGSGAPSDTKLYLDQATAITQNASKAPEDKVFKYWVVQKWNGSAYEDTDVHVYPGDTFTVLADDARKEPNGTSSEGKQLYKYTVQLRAEYIDSGDEVPTHIHFYANDQDKSGAKIPGVTTGSGGNEPKDETTYHDNIKINQAVDILPIKSVIGDSKLYSGYKFLGWAKERTATEPWLKLNENGKYTVDQDGKTYDSITQIAADEAHPFEDLYAVWEKKNYTVTVIKTTAAGYEEEVFNFQPTFNPNVSEDTRTEFKLVGKDGGATVDGVTYSNTKVFEEIPYGTKFHILETGNNYDITVTYDCADADDPSKDVTGKGTGNGSELTVDGNMTVHFHNKPKKGNIKVSKHLDVQELFLDGAALDSYRKDITVTITGPADDNGNPYSKTIKLSDFTMTDNTLYSWIDRGINVGTYHIVESGHEDLLPGYRLDEASNVKETTIVVLPNSDPEAVSEGQRLENQYRGKKGTLTVKKIVDGTIGKDKDFKFIIKNTDLGVKDEDGNPQGMYVQDENAQYFTSDREKAYKFTIKDKGSVTKNLPEGTYVIEEITDSSQIAGYTLNVTYSGESAEVVENQTTEFTITNKYVRNNVDVEITKTVSGLDDGASFTITAAVSDNGTPVTELAEQPAQDQGVTVTDNKDGTLTITLTGGKTAKLKLPEAAKLVVTEAENARYTTTYKVNGGEAGTTAEIASIAGGNKVEVINTRKPVKVTVIKNVEGLDTDKAAQFSFTATGLDPASFSLYGEASEGKANSKEFPDVAAGSEISVSEVLPQGVDYFDTKIEISYTNAQGQEVKSDVEGAASGNITLESDTTITFTNKRNKQKVVIYKVAADDQTIPLGGAEFTLDGKTITSGSEGSTKGYTQEVELAVSTDKYDLIETKAPDGYNLPENKIQIIVNPDGVQYQQSDSNANAPQTAEYDAVNGRYIIKVTNNHGDELPMTGGPGTTLYTLGGLMLIISSALMYGFRMRRRERRLR